jgi:hypothetical protein
MASRTRKSSQVQVTGRKLEEGHGWIGRSAGDALPLPNRNSKIENHTRLRLRVSSDIIHESPAFFLERLGPCQLCR